jgi:hypothetical protein
MTVDLQNKLVDNHSTADIATDSESESEEHVHGEHCNHEGADKFAHVSNRNEKKAREILAKLTLKRAKNVLKGCGSA